MLSRYADYFALFGDFDGFVNFFLLDDLVLDGAVRFYLPFDGFKASPLPRTLDEYRRYRQAQLEFVAARNTRILAQSSAAT